MVSNLSHVPLVCYKEHLYSQSDLYLRHYYICLRSFRLRHASWRYSNLIIPAIQLSHSDYRLLSFTRDKTLQFLWAFPIPKWTVSWYTVTEQKWLVISELNLSYTVMSQCPSQHHQLKRCQRTPSAYLPKEKRVESPNDVTDLPALSECSISTDIYGIHFIDKEMENNCPSTLQCWESTTSTEKTWGSHSKIHEASVQWSMGKKVRLQKRMGKKL